MPEALRLDFFQWNPDTEHQDEFILRVLKAQGFITRNFCLARYISRLGAHICDIKKQGYHIIGYNYKTPNGMDYRYDFHGEKQGRDEL